MHPDSAIALTKTQLILQSDTSWTLIVPVLYPGIDTGYERNILSTMDCYVRKQSWILCEMCCFMACDSVGATIIHNFVAAELSFGVDIFGAFIF